MNDRSYKQHSSNMASPKTDNIGSIPLDVELIQDIPTLSSLCVTLKSVLRPGNTWSAGEQP